MRLSEKCTNNNNKNSEYPLTSRRTDGGTSQSFFYKYLKALEFSTKTRKPCESSYEAD